MRKLTLLLTLASTFCLSGVKAQDLIVKLKGDTIKAKVLEVGTETISYKKYGNAEGPKFVIKRSEVLFIKFEDGEVQEFMDEKQLNTAVNDIQNAQQAKADSMKKANSNIADSAKAAQSGSSKNKIEFIDNKYYINGQKSNQKDVNRYLSKSSNPAIQLGLKGAKSMGTAQKIVKITSYPTTIAGSCSSLVSLVNGYQLLQRGRATSQNLINILLNGLGTAALPVTNKILTKKKNKMYDKLIDMYNQTN